MAIEWRILLLAVAAVLANVDAYSDWNARTPTLPTGIHASRSLRVNEVEERAGLPVSIVEKAKVALLLAASAKKIAGWLTKGKPANDVFVRLGLNKAGDKLFQKPRFLTWAKYVNDLGEQAPGKATTMLSTLKVQYSDEALTQMVIAAKTADDTKDVPNQLQLQQIHSWLSKGESPDDAFNLFKLNKVGDDLLANPELVTMNT
ncbi:putative secreted RxLR effector protein [Phytophthora cinnamomi]|uniref:putative secreted RxLR effector protein n=1 Tax=Phytophthora cinnamomi TaxID=4785 RepID=UPI00355A0924|nr:putative secreted RxLR effector protein [Phytophthora cinnamomi]